MSDAALNPYVLILYYSRTGGVARLAQVVRDGRRCAGGLARRSRTQVGGVEGDRRGFEAAHWAAAPLASLPL